MKTAPPEQPKSETNWLIHFPRTELKIHGHRLPPGGTDGIHIQAGDFSALIVPAQALCNQNYAEVAASRWKSNRLYLNGLAKFWNCRQPITMCASAIGVVKIGP